MTILIIGGSQGANILDQVIIKAILEIPHKIRKNIQIIQQCRPENLEKLQKEYYKNNIPAEINSFFNNMHHKLNLANLVICRAGAITIAENLSAGKPAIYIPHPATYQDHQVKNAQFVTNHNAGILIYNKNLTANILSEKILQLYNNPQKMIEMSNKSKKIAIPHATKNVVDILLQHA